MDACTRQSKAPEMEDNVILLDDEDDGHEIDRL